MMKKLNSIRVQLVLIVLVCYLVPTLLLGEYMGNVFFADLRTKTETALTSSAEHAYTLSYQNVQRAIALAKDATYDGELTAAYMSYRAGETTASECLRQCRSYIERKYSREELFPFALFLPLENPDMLVYNRAGYEQLMSFQRHAQQQALALSPELDTRCLFWEYDGQVYLIRNLLDLRMERFGMLVLGVNTDVLLADVQGLAGTWGGETEIMLGQSGSINADWDALSPGLMQTDDDRLQYVCRQQDRDYDFALRLSVPQERIYGEIRGFHRLMRGLFALLIPMLLLILWYVHKRIVKPISLLSHASRRIEAGEWGVTVPMHGDDELGRLGSAFSNMSTHIAELIDKTYKEEIVLRDAKIQAMQSRINPHFINNALETLNWEARLEGSETMSAMVESLSVLLNASLDRGGRRMVALREEMEVAHAYCYFVSLRFGERLQVHFDIDERALQSIVPLLTIQPILENAVEHGIEPVGHGEIDISGTLAGLCLRLTVTNSGKPLNEEDRLRIDRALNGENQNGHHLGLANIATRLRLIYGGRADICVQSDEKGRTVVRLDIPLDGLGGDGSCGDC